MKKESESAKLRAAVQMRIDRYFVSVLDERGGALSAFSATADGTAKVFSWRCST